MNITGTMVNYYFHCKRQCWLFANRVNMEDNSENVRIGKVLHELKLQEKRNTEVLIENIKVDKITDKYLVEMKKSDADVEAVRWQVLYYLKVLKDKGIEKQGKITFEEKNKQNHKVIYVELNEEMEKQLEKILKDMNTYLEQEYPIAPLNDKKCKKCAYFEYCYV
ncbi:CRISPR-associated protein Cas4 [Heyndrickxia coagulans]|uniref:CRISPR-associated protein Cas4 n=1 Tax=Heyndrickxia coagulans TaxID=1398 RepID=UPI002E1F77BD|nr:CRISPR-associated protein Cas4 [Heyndrickxia coagulans]